VSNIPKTIEGAASRLDRLGGIVTASEWERAAIVFAFTEPVGQGKRTDLGNVPEVMSYGQFAGLNIHGLRDHKTVKVYHDAWASAVEKTKRKRNGRVYPVSPGDPFVAPDLEWPPTGHTTGSFEKQLAGKSPEAKAEIASKLLAEPDVAPAVKVPAEKIKADYKADPKVRSKVDEAREERIQDLASKSRGKITDPQPEPVTILDEAVSAMDGVVEEAGRREDLRELLSLAQQVHEKASQWAESYAYTGVPDEVELVQQISHELSEAQWRVAAFAVDQSEDAK
jgi:hypothetical protein